MAYLHEGNRVTTAVIGSQASSSRYNDLQDQLAEMLGPRWMTIMSGFCESAGDWNFRTAPGNYGMWQGASSATRERLFMPITIPAGCTITELKIDVYAASSCSNGDIGLYRIALGDIATSDWSLVQDIGGANPWAIAGGGKETYTASALSYVTAADYSYAVVVTPSDDGGAIVLRVDMLQIEFEYGNH